MTRTETKLSRPLASLSLDAAVSFTGLTGFADDGTFPSAVLAGRDIDELSEQRALAVAEYLLSLGALRPLQVTTRGLGHREPLSGNDTEAGRRQNRRVEITILEN